MQKQTIVYVTGNQLKVDILKSQLDSNLFEVVGKDIDCPEIQSDSIEEVAKFSAKFASEQLKQTVLKNDSGLVIPALNGFPSAYSKYVQQRLTAQDMMNLMQDKADRGCYYLDAYAYCEYGKEPVVFVSKTLGNIATVPSGEGISWFDNVFVAKGHTKPMSHLSYQDFLKQFDNTGIIKLAEYISKQERK